VYIVIAGGGLFGRGLAEKLVAGRHDVVVVDQDRRVCEQIASKVGALPINGPATSIEILEEAGIRKAEVAVGALPGDADNLAFGVLARSFDVPRVLVRMTNPAYESAYELAGITRSLNMTEMFVRQLVLEIEQPAVRQVATFGRGKASIVVLRVPEKARVAGKTVREIANDADFPGECVIAGIFTGDPEEFIFPRGNADIRGGDRVFLAADSDNLRKAAQYFRRTK